MIDKVTCHPIIYSERDTPDSVRNMMVRDVALYKKYRPMRRTMKANKAA